MTESIWIGNDPREQDALRVAHLSLAKYLTRQIPVHDLRLSDLLASGLYRRPMRRNEHGRLIDELSVRDDYDGSISTEHAIARFLVPQIAGSGWALFVDCDVMFRADAAELFDGLDDSFAVQCVKHNLGPRPGVKMDGQVQTAYARKNWSSVVAFNCDHPSNKALTLEMVNSVPGRDLHRFCWLMDEEIGDLDPRWNFLIGHSDSAIDPAIVHFTEGLPNMPGYENVPHAEEWRQELERLTK